MEHKWMPFKQWMACSTCGIIQRADKKNKPCKGVVKITTREEDQND